MANKIAKWGPIDENGQKSFDGKQITLTFDGSSTGLASLYSPLIECHLSEYSTFIWNVDAVDCVDTADITIYWQGTGDAALARVNAPSNTGWTQSNAVLTLTGSGDMDNTETVLLDGITNVKDMTYQRFRFLSNNDNPGAISITCRLTNIPSVSSRVMTFAHPS